MAYFKLYQDNADEYRWSLRGANHEIVAVASEGYSTKSGAKNAIQWVKANAAKASVKDETKDQNYRRWS